MNTGYEPWRADWHDWGHDRRRRHRSWHRQLDTTLFTALGQGIFFASSIAQNQQASRLWDWTAATPTITVTPSLRPTTTRSGGQDSFTISLSAAPIANVSIPLSVSNPKEGSVSTSSVVFTPANWNIPQTVVVMGLNDHLTGDIPYSIITGAAVSVDGSYSGIDPADIAFVNSGINRSQITVTPSLRPTTTRSGGQDSFTISLSAAPIANVSIPLSVSNPKEGSVSTSSVVFTPANWNIPQTVVVMGLNDHLTGDIPYSIITGAAVSAYGSYSGIDPADIAFVNSGINRSQITVTPSLRPTTTRSGGQDSFTISLSAAPIANVSIPLSVSNPKEGSVSTSSVVFTPANWNIPQTVVVMGLNDHLTGDIPYSIITGAAVSADGSYSGIDPADIAFVNSGINRSQITVTPSLRPTTTRSGGQDSFTISLSAAPIANVSIPLSVSNPKEGSVSTSSVVFTPANWNIPQTVVVMGLNDHLTGDIPYSIITGAAVSADGSYSGIDPADIAFVNSGINRSQITVTPSLRPTTTRSGGQDSFTISLSAAPIANVSIPLSVSNPKEGSVSTSSVVFTPANWNIPQTVVVMGLNDHLTGDIPYSIITGAAVSADGSYSGIDPADIAFVNSGINRSQIEAAAADEAQSFAANDGVPDSMMDNPEMCTDYMAMLALVPVPQATNLAITSGAWSDPNTWMGQKVPANGADVWIMPGRTVLVDGVIPQSLHTIRVSGTLQFATDRDTQLRVDTIAVDSFGTYLMGTQNAPIAAGKTAQVLFSDTGPIDRTWDPYMLSRGLISAGTVRINGQKATQEMTMAHPSSGACTNSSSTAPYPRIGRSATRS